MGHVALMLALVLAIGAAPAGAEVRRGPGGPAFYEPPRPLPGKRHGDPIWIRRLATGEGLKAASRNERILYRSSGLHGEPVAVSGVIALPKGKAPKGGWPVVTWGHGSTGIADECAPSREPTDVPNFDGLLNAGLAVVFTDYQGLGTPGTHLYLVGKTEARSMLDIVRAARTLHPRLGRRVIIGGNSQGGHGALWATALAPTWTPELDVEGTVAIAPPSHIRRQSEQISTLTQACTAVAALAAMIVRGVDASHPKRHLARLLTPAGAALYPQTLTRCFEALIGPDSFGRLAPADLFRTLTPALDLLGKSDPERLVIKTPLFIAQGTADPIVRASFTDQLQRNLTANGAKIEYHRYAGKDHFSVIAASYEEAVAFTRRQLKR